MKKQGSIVFISDAIYVQDYKIQLRFNDGKVQIVDFGPFLSSSTNCEIRKYLNIRTFQKFTIVNGDLDWNDFDLVFPVADLYNNKI